MKRKCFLLAIVLAFSLLMATNASAYLLTLTDPNTDLSGYAGPYAQVNVVLSSPLNSPQTATITATALNGYGLGDGAALALNVNGTFSVVVGSISYTPLPGYTPPTNYVTSELWPNGHVDGFGYFNLALNAKDFSDPLATISFTLTAAAGTWTNDQSVLTLNNKNYLAAAHVKPAGTNVLTGFAAGPGTGAVVPISAAAWLLGSGLLGLVVIRRRFKK
jgi:hypothetical protein